LPREIEENKQKPEKSLCPGRDLKQSRLKHKSEALLLKPTFFIFRLGTGDVMHMTGP